MENVAAPCLPYVYSHICYKEEKQYGERKKGKCLSEAAPELRPSKGGLTESQMPLPPKISYTLHPDTAMPEACAPADPRRAWDPFKSPLRP